jgi:hypothetical protein
MKAPQTRGAAHPERDAGRSDPTNVELLGGVLDTFNKPTTLDLQVSWLSRRFGVDASVACLIASLAFDVAEGWR